MHHVTEGQDVTRADCQDYLLSDRASLTNKCFLWFLASPNTCRPCTVSIAVTVGLTLVHFHRQVSLMEAQSAS